MAEAATTKATATAAIEAPAPSKWMSRCTAQMSAPRGFPDPGNVGRRTAAGLIGRYLGRSGADNDDPATLRARYADIVAADVPHECAAAARRLTGALVDLNVGMLCDAHPDGSLGKIMAREGHAAATEAAGTMLGFTAKGFSLAPPDRLVRAIAYPVDAYTVADGDKELTGSSWPTAAALLVLRACRLAADALEHRTTPSRSFELLAPSGWPLSDQTKASAALQRLLGVATPLDCTGTADRLTNQLIVALLSSVPKGRTDHTVGRTRETASELLTRAPVETAGAFARLAIGSDAPKATVRRARALQHVKEAAARAAGRAFTRTTANQDMAAVASMVERALAGEADAGTAVKLAGRLAPDDSVLRGWLSHYLEMLGQAGEALAQGRELLRHEREAPGSAEE